MSDFFGRISNAKWERLTSEVLAYLLDESIPCREAFLTLLGISVNPESCKFRCEYHIGNGYVDLVVLNDSSQPIVFIENKPWGDDLYSSSFTYGNQLKRYADALKAEKSNTKILCLLATERNKNDLLKAAAEAEGEGIASDETSLKQHFNDNYGISFITITWQQVLEQLGVLQPENVTMNLVEKLQHFLFPPVAELTPELRQNEESIRENWPTFLETVKSAKKLFMEMEPSRFSVAKFSRNITPDGDRKEYCGYYITDQVTGLTCFFGVHLPAWRFLTKHGRQSPFVLMVSFDRYQQVYDNRSADGKPIIDPGILKMCGFEYDEPPYDGSWPCDYVYPLTDSSDGRNITSEEQAKELAKALSEILKKVSGEE